MLAIDTSKVEAYAAWLEQEAVALPRKVSTIFLQWAQAIHAEITIGTPQWSGNLAANWALDVGSKSYTAQYFVGEARDRPFTEGGRGGGPRYSAGMEPSVSVSLERAKAARMPALFESIFIHNPAVYADSIEDDTNDPPVRPINRWPRSEAGKVMMVQHAYFKHTLDGQALIHELAARPS